MIISWLASEVAVGQSKVQMHLGPSPAAHAADRHTSEYLVIGI